MLPELINLGSISIKTYGFFVATGFLVALYFTVKLAKLSKSGPQFIIDLSLYLLISGILGARLFYVLLNWHYFSSNIKDIFFIWNGGLVFYGGLLAALLTGSILIRFNKLNFLSICDIFTPGIFIGLSIGRIGCLFAGCCYGKETNLPWGIIFTNSDCLAPLGIKLHPAQIYESIYTFIIFILLLNTFKYKKFNGQLFLSGILLYSIFRFINELFRADDRGVNLMGLYPSQLISIIFAVISIIMLLILWKKSKSSK